MVFDEGRIVEVGTYDELVQRGGVFTELVMSAEHGFAEEGVGPSPCVNGAVAVPAGA